MTMLYGFLNIRIRKYSQEEMEAIKNGEVATQFKTALFHQ